MKNMSSTVVFSRSDRDVIVGCFDSSVGICPGDFVARVHQSVEIVFKACDYIRKFVTCIKMYTYVMPLVLGILCTG